MNSLLSQYEEPWTFSYDTSHGVIEHQIYSAGKGQSPSILVLHELPGLTRRSLELGLHLAKQVPARVHLPLLFGKAEPDAVGRAANMFRVCLSREIHLFAANKTSPVVDWLRAVCRKLKTQDQSGAAGIGVIGMCLTGGFALALVADRSVIAPVVAQPSLPLFIHKDEFDSRRNWCGAHTFGTTG